MFRSSGRKYRATQHSHYAITGYRLTALSLTLRTSGMLKNVELPFYPSTTNCLVWSEDGELAIAAGEFIHLLVELLPFLLFFDLDILTGL